MTHQTAQAPALSTFIKAWTILTMVIGLGLFIMLAAGPHLLPAGNVVWSWLRYLASPLI